MNLYHPVSNLSIGGLDRNGANANGQTDTFGIYAFDTLALTDHGRVELGASAVRSIVDGFCDSPYLLQEDYETTLLELVDAFYYFKNACGEQLTDAELIEAMRARYDAYDGSVEAVIGTTLEALCRARRFGLEEEADWEDEDDDRFDE